MDYDNVELIHKIARMIHSERNREIIKDRLIHKIPYKELVDKYHLTEDTMIKIVSKAKKKLFQ